MNSINSLDDLDDTDASKLAGLINKIMSLACESASHGSASSHQIYVMARDARDLLLFDAQSRETMQKLATPMRPIVQGLEISLAVEDYLKTGQKIHAIKQLRLDTGAGLLEAKNAVEAFAESLHSF
jgi:hypothetical protein